MIEEVLGVVLGVVLEEVLEVVLEGVLEEVLGVVPEVVTKEATWAEYEAATVAQSGVEEPRKAQSQTEYLSPSRSGRRQPWRAPVLLLTWRRVHPPLYGSGT